ncbi:MAG: hypothetical protein IKE30_07525 [Clostridia bacterium]|nr:hypothetical protein [Clostridia bacterium]
MRSLLRAAGLPGDVLVVSAAGRDLLTFECDPLTEDQAALLRHHSSLLMCCALDDCRRMMPLFGRGEAALGDDLGGILKYRGKTNEAFTRFLIDLAFLFGDHRSAEPFVLFDPMCGRGTTMFEALNLGFSAIGADIRSSDLDEGARFLKKYLEEGRFKHQIRKASRTIPGGHVPLTHFTMETARGALTADFLAGDAAAAAAAMGKSFCHATVCDLPYGVQHGPGKGESLEKLTERVLKALFSAIKPGGCVVLSFNTFTLKTNSVYGMMEKAGFEPLTGDGFDTLRHRVEQAIVRDVAVGKRAQNR